MKYPTGGTPDATSRRAIVDRGIVATMSRTGDCYDSGAEHDRV